MDETYRDQLRHKFRFDEWASPPAETAKPGTSAEGVGVAGAELGGWVARRVEQFTLSGAPSASRSFWSGGGHHADVLLRLDLMETASPSAARELLLELLGEFQSPQIERLPDPAVGDLAFAVPGATALLFTRGQVVAWIRNAGRGVVPVDAFARLVDERLARGTGASPG